MTRTRRRLAGVKTKASGYQRYLGGALWKEIRSRVLKRDGGRCVVCGKPASQVHHRSYEPVVLSGDDDSKLTSLCGPCHELIEFDNGVKNTLRRANRKLAGMLDGRGAQQGNPAVPLDSSVSEPVEC